MRLMRSAFSEVLRLRKTTDVMHVHGVGPVPAAVASAARLARIPCVSGLRSSGQNADRLHVERHHGAFVGGAIWRLQFACSNVLGVKTSRMAQECTALGIDADKVRIVPNGVDLDEFARVPPPAPDARTLVFLGRMVIETKGLDVLAKAWEGFVSSDRGADWRLLLQGDGRDSARVRELFENVPNVEMAAATDDVGAVLGAASALVLPSRAEGFSNVLLEALASGRPILGTRVSGTEDAVDSACGWLVDPGDAIALQVAMEHLAELSQHRLVEMSRAAREKAQSYGIDDVAVQWLKLYEGISRA